MVSKDEKVNQLSEWICPECHVKNEALRERCMMCGQVPGGIEKIKKLNYQNKSKLFLKGTLVGVLTLIFIRTGFKTYLGQS